MIECNSANLLSEWHKERGITSSSTDMVMCYSYQRIIGMGEKAVPLLLEQIEREGEQPDHWFYALRMLTGKNPVPKEARGNLKKMAQIWLEWARAKYDW